MNYGDVSVMRPEVDEAKAKDKKKKEEKAMMSEEKAMMAEEKAMMAGEDDDAMKAFSEDDLIKSLDKIEELAKAATPDAQKRTLLQKALNEGLNEEENGNLQVLLSGGSLEPTLGEEVSKALNPEEDSALAKSIDVSDALGEIHGGIVTALQTLGETIEKGGNRQSEVNLVLAKGLLDIGKLAQHTNSLIKSLEEQFNMVSRQPVGPRRSAVRPSEVVAKSHAGQPAADNVSKAEVMGLMSEMLQKSMESGNKALASELNSAITKIELTGDVEPRHLAQVADYRQRKLNGAAL